MVLETEVQGADSWGVAEPTVGDAPWLGGLWWRARQILGP